MRLPVPICPAPRGRETIPVLIAFFLLAAACVPGFAADDCAAVLREAERSYQVGRIEEALRVRDACLEGEATNDERARAHALLAKVYLARDEIDQAVAAIAAAVGLDPDYSPSPADPWRFVHLVDEEKGRLITGLNVSTVSKVDEPLREAPATVLVITAEEIERRGYLDLEELLHDLPGFDISRGNGDVYSNIYMRGYRSDRSDRMLLLIDGVEQNDLHSNTVYLSRQYPLSNVDRVEVIYGPASTIYGANAFTGVISVTTRQPEAFLEEGRNLGFSVQAGSGSFATNYLDATVAGRNRSGNLSWSLTGRRYRSDEQDLSGFDDWDYDFSALNDIDYQQAMRIEGALAVALAPYCMHRSKYCEVEIVAGEVVAIQPTAKDGVDLARQKDNALFEKLGRSPEFSDETDDWGLDAKVQVQNLTFGFQTWRREEGTTPWYTDLLRSGSRSGSVGTPSQTSVYARYARYSRPIGGNMVLSLSSRFKQHATNSSMARFVTYAGKGMTVVDFVDLAVRKIDSSFQRIIFDQKSSQFRNELMLIYQPSSRFNLISGIELRSSSVQLEFKSSIEEQIPSSEFDPTFDFTFFETQVTSSKTEVTDLGLFSQASYKPRDDFKIVLGARIDTNRVRNEEAFLTFDFEPTAESNETDCDSATLCDLTTQSFELNDSGTVFNPRLALVHTHNAFVFKAIYAGAFKEPSNFQRFTREPGVRDYSSPDLESERVHNFELGLSWQPREGLFLDFAAYQANYTNAVGLTQRLAPGLFDYPTTSGEFKNIGALRIRGAQLNASLKYRKYDFFGNYSYTEPFNTEPRDELGNRREGIEELRIGDIASHRLNLGVHIHFREKLNLNLRTNWVGARKTGAGTTVAANPQPEIDSYFVAHATLGYEGFPAGATWQLVVKNLFDTEYDHPGVQRAGWGFASRLPQPGRTIYLRFLYQR